MKGLLILLLYLCLISKSHQIEVWNKDKSLPKEDECQDFVTDVFICKNEGVDAVYARYGREYKGHLPRTDMFTMCRLKKSEWFRDEKGKKEGEKYDVTVSCNEDKCPDCTIKSKGPYKDNTIDYTKSVTKDGKTKTYTACLIPNADANMNSKEVLRR